MAPSYRTALFLLAAAASAACGGTACGKKGSVQTAPDAGPSMETLLPPAPESDPRGDALWAAVATPEADEADFARAADYLGVVGVLAGKANRDHGLVYRTLGFTEGWDAFPPLAEAVAGGDARDAALTGLLQLTSRERFAVDVEAPEDLFAAADALAKWVGDGGGTKEERGRAVTALRRLVAWGWVAKPQLLEGNDATK